jgi:hypothetical protein
MLKENSPQQDSSWGKPGRGWLLAGRQMHRRLWRRAAWTRCAVSRRRRTQTCVACSQHSPNLLVAFLQVVSGLDDALMCLAELQLQQEGTDSCAAALGKACRCVKRLQESLSAVDPASPSANPTKLLVEVRLPGHVCWL